MVFKVKHLSDTVAKIFEFQSPTWRVRKPLLSRNSTINQHFMQLIAVTDEKMQENDIFAVVCIRQGSRLSAPRKSVFGFSVLMFLLSTSN